MKKYGKNNPYFINIAHSFEYFLLMCNFLEELPGGIAEFTGLMSTIIHDYYNVDLDLVELKSVVREVKEEVDEYEIVEKPSTSGNSKLEWSHEELQGISKEACAKHFVKTESKQNALYQVKVNHILEKIRDTDPEAEVVKPELRAALVHALRQDEKEFWISRLKLKGDCDSKRHCD